MKFCSECFADVELKRLVDSIENKGVCDVFGKESEHIYDTSKHDTLKEYFEELLNVYTSISAINPDIIKAKPMTLSEDLTSRGWGIFNLACNPQSIYNIIKSVCVEKYEESPEIFDGPVVIQELYNDNYRQTHALLHDSTWDDFANSLKYQNRFHSNYLNTSVLTKACYSSLKKYPKGSLFYRGRISDVSGFEKEKMGAPTNEQSSGGRANPSGIRCLYLASDVETTIHEVRAGILDYITIGTFELKEDITIVDFSKFSNISPFKFSINGDLVEYILNKPHFEKFNTEMGRAVRKTDSKLDYLPTQYICNFIKSLSLNFPQFTGKIMGVEYNSTLSQNGFNLAVFEPDVFDCIDTQIHLVQSLTYTTDKI